MTELPRLAAAARRAPTAAKVAKLEEFLRCSEGEVADLHDTGPNAMASLDATFHTAKLGYRTP
jgi:hypothetical protein